MCFSVFPLRDHFQRKRSELLIWIIKLLFAYPQVRQAFYLCLDIWSSWVQDISFQLIAFEVFLPPHFILLYFVKLAQQVQTVFEGWSFFSRLEKTVCLQWIQIYWWILLFLFLKFSLEPIQMRRYQYFS